MTEKFEKKFFKLIPPHLQEQTKNRIKQLAKNPYVGKPLKYEFIRELKIEKFRIYFIIFEKEIIILLADVSNKKHQQEIINNIFDNRDLLQKSIKNLNDRGLI